MENDTKKLWVIIPALILLNNIVAIYHSIYHKPFNQDDFQHVHNAWNQFSGLLVYRDFFEHHGPLYTFLNSFLLNKLENPASFETLIIFRHYSFFLTLLILVLIFLIAKFFLKSRSLALLSSTVFTMWHISQSVAVEIRPDLLQTVFELLGFYILLVNLKTRRVLGLLLSGCFFGLMISCNFKSIILLVAIFLFLFYEYYKEREARSLMIGLCLGLGVLFVYSLFAIYFYSQGALRDFLYYNTWFNFQFSNYWSYGNYGIRYTLLNFAKDFMLCIFTLLGILSIGFKSKSQQLLLVCSLLPLYGCFNGLFPHYCIIFLPFMSIFASQGFNHYLIQRELKRKGLVILFLMGLALLTSNIKKTKVNESPRYLSQKNTLEFTLKHFSRDREIATYSRACPAYVFNKDFHYLWFESYDINRILEKYPFDLNQLEQLKTSQKPIVAFMAIVDNERTHKRQAYFSKNYQLLGPAPFQCIWQAPKTLSN
ncbi:MAG: glycosyltransferase family 39 protein [Cyanobacteria bacterium]|nr:glycosyltransferase family 39 protein [Cyanobacteriota bacterium]MDA1021578.1 glycosyltransferase family 39 protein [Cyanobacteriota bacterium]